MTVPMPQAFADALCNERNTHLYQAHLADEADKVLRSILTFHQGVRMRGIEGQNGVACRECTDRARAIWQDYQRILGQ